MLILEKNQLGFQVAEVQEGDWVNKWEFGSSAYFTSRFVVVTHLCLMRELSSDEDAEVIWTTFSIYRLL